MKLTLKFALITLIPILALVASYYVSVQAMEQLAQNQVEQQARLVMAAAKAARDYTSNELKPLFKDLADGADGHDPGRATDATASQGGREAKPAADPAHAPRKEFIKPTIPAYAARRILSLMFEKNPEFEGYLYKEAVKNPTLDKDKADQTEAAWIDDFSNSLTQEEIKEITIKDGKEVWCFAKRMEITKSCLDCHGKVDDVKKPDFIDEFGDMVAAYGGESKIGGFDWREGDFAAQVVYVPKDKPYRIARSAVNKIGLVLMLSGIVMVLLLWQAVNILVLRPVASLSQMADQISQGRLSATELPVKGKDEIAQLTVAFNRMNKSLYKAVKRLKGE